MLYGNIFGEEIKYSTHSSAGLLINERQLEVTVNLPRCFCMVKMWFIGCVIIENITVVFVVIYTSHT